MFEDQEIQVWRLSSSKEFKIGSFQVRGDSSLKLLSLQKYKF